MSIEEVKDAYVKKDEYANHKAKVWSEGYVFGVNTNGESFWSIGVSYISELLSLLGNKEKYDKFSISEIIEIIDNEDYVQDLLKTTSNSEYTKLKEILTLSDSVKKVFYTYVKNKLMEYLSKQKKFNLNESNKIYHELSDDSFCIGANGEYVASNVLFNNFKVDKIEISGDVNKGFATLQTFIEKYKDEDLKKICVELLMADNSISDWDDNATSYEGVYRLLSEKIYYIGIEDSNIEIWFGTNNSAFGGHSPVLYLDSVETKKSVELVG